MKKSFFYTGILMLLITSVRAQDVHFTQYFSSPLTLNPALTGLTQSGFRLAANYRSQWASVAADPYITGGFSYDMGALQRTLGNGDQVGIGILGLYDRAGRGGLQNTTVSVSVAYHKAFGDKGQHTLSAGVQGALVQKSLDFSRLTFNDQYLAGVVVQPTRESGMAGDMSYPDFNAGLMYFGSLAEAVTLYAGASYYHITRPVETYFSGNNRISSRFTAYLGSAFSLDETTELFISSLYQQQGEAKELVAGSAVGFVLNPYAPAKEDAARSMLYLGGWYRFGDAIAPYISLAWSRMQIGFSYDVSISKFTAATNYRSAFEVSLLYNGRINNFGFRKDPKLYTCPRF